MSLQYIIDGYNVIRHQAFSHPLKTKNSRRSLIEFIRFEKPCGSAKNSCLVVFDGYPEAWNVRESDDYVQVIFSGEESADERIKRIIEKSGNPRIVTVVSDDKEIKFFAKAQAANWLSVEEFLLRKKNVKIIDKNDSNKPGLTFQEMDQINKEFKQKWLK